MNTDRNAPTFRPASLARSIRVHPCLSVVKFGLGLFAVAIPLRAQDHAAPAPVVFSEHDETIPTYLSGPPDPNPMFYFGRQSQGAEGRIYPYPLYDNLTNVKGTRSYHLLTLENEFVKITVAPEIGGRLLSAIDKTNGYDFVYHQHVIKPALIGLIGAWISGGIEWNIPHHHRASTFLPVQAREEDNGDGSKTIWVGELEVRHRMRWAVGYTLHPGSSVLTCQVRIINRTPLEQTMLCFANVAVHANENYQIIFPPRTQWVTFHTKNQFSEWPISHQRFNGADFTGGVDVSWYKNHQNANSMFAWNYEEDFFAGYDHGKDAGTMSVADHHIVPGKKFWTWGNGPRGRMWDQILTDDDGPYVELMVGAYSDNQPDYSWLAPFETRAFEMHWYPFRGIGGMKNANLDAATNLEIKDGNAKFGFTTTRAFANATARLTVGGKTLVEEQIAIDPGKPYTKTVVLPAGVDEHDVRAILLGRDAPPARPRTGGPPVPTEDRELIAYSPVKLTPLPQPAIVTPPAAPKDIANEEELFLAGQRIDQFHDPRLDADPYWAEALRRDPGDVEANTGMGRLALRNAKFAEAEGYFRKAVDRLTAKYTAPKNAEPLYYLGVALKAQDKNAEAVDAFYKAAWSQEWKSPAYFALAELASARGDFDAALEFTNRSLDANALNVRAYGLKAAMLRHLDRKPEALDVIAAALERIDPLDPRLIAERWLAESGTGFQPVDIAAAPRQTRGPEPVERGSRSHAAVGLVTTLNEFSATAQELAAEYANAGLWRDGADVLAAAVAGAPAKTEVSPMVYYYLGDFAERLGATAKAADYRRVATAVAPTYVFPFQSEAIGVLQRAIVADPSDSRAPYYLGNLLFDWQPAEAITLWEKSAALDPTLPVVWRNLAQAYSHQPGDEARAKAIACLEKAVALPNADATQFAELDQLYEGAGTSVEKRLALLDAHRATVIQKDEGRATLVTLETFVGKPDDAITLLNERVFSVWEGGTRFDTGAAWTEAHLVRGLQQLDARNPMAAVADFDVALKYPANLRAGERPGRVPREAELAYWRGVARDALGDSAGARAAWTEAAKAGTVTTPAGRGGGGRGGFGAGVGSRVGRYFQALALRKTGDPDQATAIFHELVSAGETALAAQAPDDATLAGPGFAAQTPRARTAAAHYIAGLGHAGLGEKEKARDEFNAALAAAPDHLGAKLAIARL
jgi:tetratricopeptide (TPR) repeat protein